ncbi:MAG: squalene/phytoene synthase family protein [Hyphomicrobiales bacterium]|nr:squalene/phytoene synthase family protein [Rickettsiales bacterium]MCP5361185.1 squalene/phytoene synthase family protein [Hyphomicrobiales bacterium]
MHYSANLVRQHARNMYYCLLFSPSEVRDRLFCLQAIQIELARIPAMTPDPTLRMIRHNWWQEHLLRLAKTGALAADVAQHPLLASLAATLPETPLNPVSLAAWLNDAHLYADELPPEQLQEQRTQAHHHFINLMVESLTLSPVDYRPLIKPMAHLITGMEQEPPLTDMHIKAMQQHYAEAVTQVHALSKDTYRRLLPIILQLPLLRQDLRRMKNKTSKHLPSPLKQLCTVCWHAYTSPRWMRV